MYVTGLSKVGIEAVNMEGALGVLKQIPLSRSRGVPNFSFRVFTIEPGGHTPLHQHPFEHMNYIIEGEGMLVGEEIENKLSKGDFALVLPNEIHQFKNTSTTIYMVMICAVPKEYE